MLKEHQPGGAGAFMEAFVRGERGDPRLDPIFLGSTRSQVKSAEGAVQGLVDLGVIDSSFRLDPNLDLSTVSWSGVAEALVGCGSRIGQAYFGCKPDLGMALILSGIELIEKVEDQDLSREDRDFLEDLKVRALNDLGIVAGESGAEELFLEQAQRAGFLSEEDEVEVPRELGDERYTPEVLNTLAFVLAKKGRYSSAIEASRLACQYFHLAPEGSLSDLANRKANALRRFVGLGLIVGEGERRDEAVRTYFYSLERLKEAEFDPEYLAEAVLLRSIYWGFEETESTVSKRYSEMTAGLIAGLQAVGFIVSQEEHGLYRVFDPSTKKELIDVSYQLTHLQRLKTVYQLRDQFSEASEGSKEVDDIVQRSLVLSFLEDHHNAARLGNQLGAKMASGLIEQELGEASLEGVDWRYLLNHANYDPRLAQDLRFVMPGLASQVELSGGEPASRTRQKLATRILELTRVLTGMDTPGEIWQRLTERLYEGRPSGLFSFWVPRVEVKGVDEFRDLIKEFNRKRAKRRQKLELLLLESQTPLNYHQEVLAHLREVLGVGIYSPSSFEVFNASASSREMAVNRAVENPGQHYFIVDDGGTWALFPHPEVDGLLAKEWLEDFYKFCKQKRKEVTEPCSVESLQFGRETVIFNQQSLEGLDPSWQKKAAFLALISHLITMGTMFPEKNHSAVVPAATGDRSRLAGIPFSISPEVIERLKVFEYTNRPGDKLSLKEQVLSLFERYRQTIKRGLTHPVEPYRLAFAAGPLQTPSTMVGAILVPGEVGLFDQGDTVSTLRSGLVEGFVTCLSQTREFLPGSGMGVGASYNSKTGALTVSLRIDPEASYYTEAEINRLKQEYFERFRQVFETLKKALVDG